MSKKDYVAMAEIFRDGLETLEKNPKENATGSAVVDMIALRMARLFKADNPSFRPIQFLTACGYSVVQAGSMAARI